MSMAYNTVPISPLTKTLKKYKDDMTAQVRINMKDYI